jgi:glycosyltransferase involved in cell wall biosynthesis
MKVIHVITGMRQGGAEAMLEKLITAGRHYDPDVTQEVINLGPAGVVGDRLAATGVPVESLGLSFSMRGAATAWALWRRLKREDPRTVIQTWLWHADLAGGLCARLAGARRIVWNLRNSMPRSAPIKTSSLIVSRLCAVLSRWIPTRIVCNSRSALEAHVAIGYERDKCVVIGNGFDVRQFARDEGLRQSIRNQWGIGRDAIAIGMVARADPLKDHATFIRSAAMLVGEFPSVRFVLVGDGITTDEAIAAEIDEKRLAPRFVLQGRTTDVSGVLSALDVFCLSSISEGFPNVIGEAMACETPVVSTDAGDTREILADDSRIAPTRDAGELAARLSRVVRMSEDQRRRIGREQRRRVQDIFEIGVIWRAYLRLYEGL